MADAPRDAPAEGPDRGGGREASAPGARGYHTRLGGGTVQGDPVSDERKLAGPWGRLLLGTLDLGLAVLSGLGARGGRWEWKKQTWRRALEERIAAWENLERGVRARTRMCRECRTLVERSASTCPACGASMSGIPKGGLARALGLAFPGALSVTTLLISANVLMSLMVLVLWGRGPEAGLSRLLSPPGEALFVLGAKWTPAILHGQIWRLVTANYLHGGLIHLAFNCYALLSLGPLIEESFGARKFFLVYTATGVCALATSALLRPHSMSIGASGALFGLLGFAVVYGRFRGGAAGRAISDQLIRYVILGVVMFLIPGIDSVAHMGGLLSGGLLGLVVEAGEPRSRGGELALRWLCAIAVVATLGSFAAMALSYGENLAALGR